MVNCELYFVDSDLFIVRCQLRNVSCEKWTASEPVLEVSRGVLSHLGSVLAPFWSVLGRLEPPWRRLGDVLEAPKTIKNRSWSIGSMMATGLFSRILNNFQGKTIFPRIALHRVKGDLSFLMDFGCPRLSKWKQIWSKIDIRTRHQIKTVLSSLTDRFLRENSDQNQTHFS